METVTLGSVDVGAIAPTLSERSSLPLELPAERPQRFGVALQPMTRDGLPYGPTGALREVAIREAWVEFLSRYPMHWFCTLTFRNSVHPERAVKVFRLWVNEINRSLYGKRWAQRGQGIYWFLAWEYQKRGVLHFHALLGDTENLNDRARRLTWMDRWFELAGIARIEDIKNRAAIDRYVSKYVVKGGQIDSSETLKSFAQQQSLSNPKR
jgi:hypothetical protein